MMLTIILAITILLRYETAQLGDVVMIAPYRRRYLLFVLLAVVVAAAAVVVVVVTAV